MDSRVTRVEPSTCQGCGNLEEHFTGRGASKEDKRCHGCGKQPGFRAPPTRWPRNALNRSASANVGGPTATSAGIRRVSPAWANPTLDYPGLPWTVCCISIGTASITTTGCEQEYRFRPLSNVNNTQMRRYCHLPIWIPRYGSAGVVAQRLRCHTSGGVACGWKNLTTCDSLVPNCRGESDRWST